MSWFKEQTTSIKVLVLLIIVTVIGIIGVSGYIGIKAVLDHNSVSSDGVAEGTIEDIITPPLEVYEPTDYVVTSKPQIKFEGSTLWGTSLALNDKIYPVTRDGSFSITVDLKRGENNFVLKAWKRIGAFRQKEFIVIYKPPSKLFEPEPVPTMPEQTQDQTGQQTYQPPIPQICPNCGGSGIVPGAVIDGIVQSDTCPVCGGRGTI